MKTHKSDFSDPQGIDSDRSNNRGIKGSINRATERFNDPMTNQFGNNAQGVHAPSRLRCPCPPAAAAPSILSNALVML